MREKHLQIGSKKVFDEYLLKIGVKTESGNNSEGLIGKMYGLKVVEKSFIPTHLAHLVDKDGQLLQVFNLRK